MPLLRRFPLAAAVALTFLVARPATAQVNYSVTFDTSLTPGADFTPYYSALTNAIQAAGADWARYFQAAPTPVTLSVRVTFDPNIGTANGGSGTTAFVRTTNGINTFQQGAATKLMTGSVPFPPPNGFDVEFHVGTSYLTNTLWFDPNPHTRTAVIPSNRVDAYSVFTHEFGHAFVFNGWRDGTTGALPGNYQSTFDSQVITPTGGDTNMYFNGPAALAVRGSPVPLTFNNYGHYGNGNLNGTSNGRPGVELIPFLMNGVVYNFQTRYSISALDLAFAKDSEVTLAPFRWTAGGNGNWTDAANWNGSPVAGPNSVVPNGTPFDAVIDQATGSPYTVAMFTPVTLNALTVNSPNATFLQAPGAAFTASSASVAAGTYLAQGGTANVGILTVAGGATFTLGGGSVTAQNFQRNVDGIVNLFDGTLTVGGPGGGTLGWGSGSIDIRGSTAAQTPQLVLDNVGSVTGVTAVNIGDASGNTGVFTIKSGTNTVTIDAPVTVTKGELRGTGNLTQGVTVKGSGVVEPGNVLRTAGQFTVAGGLGFESGSRFRWDLTSKTTSGAGVNFDQIRLTAGNLSINTGARVELFFPAGVVPSSADAFWQSPHSWTIIDVDGGTNTGATNFGGVANASDFASAGTFALSSGPGGDVVLTFTPVPEPAAVVGLAAAGLALGAWWRRSRSRPDGVTAA